MQSKPPHLTSDCGIMFSWAHTWYHFATSAHLVQCKCKSQHRRGRGKKWSAAAFIIFHHQLFTTLFAGPKKHFTCPRQEKTILTVESRLKGLTLWSLLRQPSTRMELMCWKNAKVHFFFFGGGPLVDPTVNMSLCLSKFWVFEIDASLRICFLLIASQFWSAQVLQNCTYNVSGLFPWNWKLNYSL